MAKKAKDKSTAKTTKPKKVVTVGENKEANNALKDEKSTWDSLYELKDDTVNVLIKQQELIKEFLNVATNELNKEGKKEAADSLLVVMNGVFKSLEDIATLLRNNMELHITFGDNNKIVDYRKGIVNEDGDDFFDYLSIANNYVFAQDQISDITYKAYTEIVAVTKANVSPKVKKDIENIKLEEFEKEYIDYKENNAEIVQTAFEKAFENKKEKE